MAGSSNHQGDVFVSVGEQGEVQEVEAGMLKAAPDERNEEVADNKDVIGDVKANRDARIKGTKGDATQDLVVVNEDKRLEAATADSDNAKDYKIIDIDDRLSYRQGWPLLPVLPVLTSRDNVPRAFSPLDTHLAAFRTIVKQNNITVHGLEVAHRYNSGTPTNKATLTLCILSEEKESTKWPDTIRALRTYLSSQKSSLTLAIEMIDHRVFHGLYTLRILPHESGLASATKKKRHGVVQILNESGLEWTSVEFWWRGMSKKREDCRPTVLIGTGMPQKSGWWGDVMERLQKKMGGKWVVEVCYRTVVKY